MYRHHLNSALGYFTRILVGAIACGAPLPTRALDLTPNHVAQLYVQATFTIEGARKVEGNRLRKFAIQEPLQVILGLSPDITKVAYQPLHSELAGVTADLTSHAANVVFDLKSREEAIELGSRRDGFPGVEFVILVMSRTEMFSLAQRLGSESDYARLLGSLQPRPNEALCFGLVGPAGIGTLQKAAIYIEYTPDRTTTCLYEETMQAFGLFSDFRGDTQSLFNDDNDDWDRPTPLDWTLWAIHADGRLKVGMNKEEAYEAAKPVAEELLSP